MFRVPAAPTTAIIALLLSLPAATILAAEKYSRPQVPVVIGGEADFDACGGLGVVAGLDPNGDGFLAVKAGPGLQYKRIDRLHNGNQVHMCGEKGDWIAVIYSMTRQDCNVSTPWPKRQPYTGPCRSGWAHKKWIKLLAG